MTKEELKQEAEEKSKKRTKGFACQENCEKSYVMGALDFAEPREKRIAELEHQLTHRNCVDCSNHSSKLKMRTLELEKENAELKAFKEKCKFNVGDICKDIETENNLAKAKEIIRELLTCARNYPESNKQKMQKAEQFLKDYDIDNATQQANKGLDLDKIADEMEQDLKDSEVEK